MYSSKNINKGFAPIVMLFLVAALGLVVYFIATNKQVNFFSGASNIIQTLSGTLVKRGTAEFSPCSSAPATATYGLVTDSGGTKKCTPISAAATIAGPLLGRIVAATGNLKNAIFYATQIKDASTCYDQCPGKDGVLRNCHPPESDGTSADSICNVAGRVERCGGKSFCCPAPGGKWTTDLGLCPPPVTDCAVLRGLNSQAFTKCSQQGFSKVCVDKYSHNVIGCMMATDTDCTTNNVNAARQVECSVNTPVPTPSAAATEIYVSPAQQTVLGGRAFTFSAKMNTNTNTIQGVDVTVKYNPSVIQVTSVTQGAGVSKLSYVVVKKIDNTLGQFQYAIIAPPGSGRTVKGSGIEIVKVNAKILGNPRPVSYDLTFASSTNASQPKESTNMVKKTTPGSVQVVIP